MKAIKLHLGPDVHKDSITVPIAPPARPNKIHLFVTIPHDLHPLEKALSCLRKSQRRESTADDVEFVFEPIGWLAFAAPPDSALTVLRSI